ncbi:MAG: hypothetical protein MUP03_06695, partial [Anaerolineales bacterium]|nr:hypothetical protein [Anaerolineales bacterium]
RIVRRFFKHKMAVTSMLVLAFLYFVMIIGGFVAPYGEYGWNDPADFCQRPPAIPGDHCQLFYTFQY